MPDQLPPEVVAPIPQGLDAHRDVELPKSGPRRPSVDPRVEPTVLIAVSAGGAAGSAARYLIGQQWPAPTGTFPVSTVAINVVGCALIGILMVLVTDLWSGQRLLRPFLGTGVLGGFTTFSTYTVDLQRLLAGGRFSTAFLYLALTVIGALVAVWLAASATHRLVGARGER